MKHTNIQKILAPALSLIALLGYASTHPLSAAPGSDGKGKTTEPLNILLFTADDLNQDSLGCYGSMTPDITPNLDRFASQSVRFNRGHVTVAICQPSRGAIATGRFPHHTGVMGFMKTDRDVPTIMETLRDNGYLTGILGKVNHSTPEANYQWDMAHDQGALGNGRSPAKYYSYCQEFFNRCRKEKKPFYFMVNSHDPHRPYHIPGQTDKKNRGAEIPSRIYKPEEIEVPGFLPDIPGVRREVSYYFNSVRRLDDTFGKVMQALKESGMEGNTLVMFLSDNGVALPFAKCNAYFASTRTPWLVRWPKVIQPRVDNDHFISGIDFMPTALDAAGIHDIKGMDGRSFLPLLMGKTQSGRDRVFTQIDCKAGGDAVPMRCVQNANYGYIFNAWADQDHWYRNNNEGLSMKAMVEAAKSDLKIAERVRMFRYRVVEEFYDLEKDPDCLDNLAGNSQYKKLVSSFRDQLEAWMKETKDPLLAAFNLRDTPSKMSDAMWKSYETWGAKKKITRKKPQKNNKK